MFEASENIDPDFREIVRQLTDVVISGDSGVDELAIVGFPESLRCRVREAVREAVVERREVEAREAEAEKAEKGDDDVTGGTMVGGKDGAQGIGGGYRCVSVDLKRFVGSPEETAADVIEHWESQAAEGADFGPEEVVRLMKLVEGGKKLVVYKGVEYVSEGFGDDDVFLLTLDTGAKGHSSPIRIIVEVNPYEYAKIRAIDDGLSSGLDRSWVKAFLKGYEIKRDGLF